MEKEPSFESAARRIAAWAAEHPLSVAETEKRYAHLLSGLHGLPARKGEWAGFALGKWLVRYWKDRVDEVQQPVGGLSLAPGLAFRGGGARPDAHAAESLLKAEGETGAACVKLTENPDRSSVALALWIEPTQPDAHRPFSVTVTGAGGAVVAGPVACAPRSVLRFASFEPAGECAIVFRTEAETWQIRWQITAAQP